MRTTPWHTRLLTCLLLIGSVPPATAGLEWPLGTATDKVDTARRLQLAEAEQPNEHLVQLLHHTEIHISEHKLVKRVSLAYFYPNSEVVQNSGTDSIYWDEQKEDLRILEMRTVLPDGTTVQFDPRQVKVIDTDSSDTFSDVQEVVIYPAGLVPGAATVLVYERELHSAERYFFTSPIQSTLPKREWRYDVTWTDKAPAWHQPDDFEGCARSDKAIRCERQHLEAFDFDETDYTWDVIPAITVAEPANWQDVVDFMDERIAHASDTGGNLFQQSLQQVQAASDPLASAHDLASRQIRYASFSNGENSHLPHSVEQTLHHRYGDCKDKSTLLLNLLRSQGHNAYAALVATDREHPERLHLPSIGYFDHMVVCVRENDVERCLDPTDTYTDAATTPSWIQGKVRLNVLPGAQPSRIPLAQYLWRFEIESDLVFHPNGDQTETLVRRYHGEYASWLRGKLADTLSSEREQWLADIYSDTIATPNSHSAEHSDLEQLTSSFEIRSEVRFTEIVDPHVALDYSDNEGWISALVLNQRGGNELNGFEFVGMDLNSRYRFETGDLWQNFELGADATLESVFGTFERRYTLDGDVIQVDTRLRMPMREISLEEQTDFNRFLELVAKEAAIRFWGEVSDLPRRDADTD
jgi:hypothetical protein